MVNPNHYSDFDILMDILDRYYQYADYKEVFTKNTWANHNLRRMYEARKEMYERLFAKYEEYNPKEDPFEVNITSEVKVK